MSQTHISDLLSRRKDGNILRDATSNIGASTAAGFNRHHRYSWTPFILLHDIRRPWERMRGLSLLMSRVSRAGDQEHLHLPFSSPRGFIKVRSCCAF
jgi:hypothetical protein